MTFGKSISEFLPHPTVKKCFADSDHRMWNKRCLVLCPFMTQCRNTLLHYLNFLEVTSPCDSSSHNHGYICHSNMPLRINEGFLGFYGVDWILRPQCNCLKEEGCQIAANSPSSRKFKFKQPIQRTTRRGYAGKRLKFLNSLVQNSRTLSGDVVRGWT